MTATHIAHPGFVLVDGRWYMTLNGRIVTSRPVELAPARGERSCVHCFASCSHYCRSCREAVCESDFGVHCRDHEEGNGKWAETELPDYGV